MNYSNSFFFFENSPIGKTHTMKNMKSFLLNTNTHTKQQRNIVRYPSYSQLLIGHIYSPRSSPPHIKRDIPPRLPSKKQRSQSLTPIQPGQTMTACSTVRNFSDKYNSADGILAGEYI